MYSSRLDNMRVHNKRFGFPLRCVMTSGFSPPPLVALVQDLIHCRMYILATITGLRVGFTTRR